MWVIEKKPYTLVIQLLSSLSAVLVTWQADKQLDAMLTQEYQLINSYRELNSWPPADNQLIVQKADLAITDLTITYEREQAVDFSMPFMNLGIR